MCVAVYAGVLTADVHLRLVNPAQSISQTEMSFKLSVSLWFYFFVG